MAMTPEQAQKVIGRALPANLTAVQRRLVAQQLIAVTTALPPGSGPLSAVHGDLRAVAELLDHPKAAG